MQKIENPMVSSHVVGEPPILYFGTPVVLISTTNEDGSPNLAPMSSAWWLGWRCLLGLSNAGQTALNLRRTGECVLNLPSHREVSAVNRLALLTGTKEVPEFKKMRGYRYEPDKFETAELTPIASHSINPPRVQECPVQMEAVMVGGHNLMQDEASLSGALSAFEVKITRVHLHREILFEGNPNRVDPDKWQPLIMSFQKFYGLAPGQIHASRLSEIPESAYAALRGKTG